MYEVGRRWAAGEITIAEEHVATAITQYVVGSLYGASDPPTMSRGHAVVTGVCGELHQVGPNIVADALEADGWDVRFLGTNTPLEDIVAAVEEHDARLVGISTTLRDNVDRTRHLIDAIRSSSPDRRIMVGGRAFRRAPNLWREVGADGFAADVREAVELAESFSV